MSKVNPLSNVAVTIESYGVTIRLEANDDSTLNALLDAAAKALLDNIRIVQNSVETRHVLGVFATPDGGYRQRRDGKWLGTLPSFDLALDFFIRMIRLKVSEFSIGKVFVHAGVVGWNGKAIVIPANSGAGKTTLVIELVRLGAEYYSDEYAVLDENGMLFPFTRDLSVRSAEKAWNEKDGVPVESFGGKRGTQPIPIGTVFITEYIPNSVWKPERLTIGNGILEAILHTIPLRVNAEFSLNVLKNALSRAIILKSPRPDAAETAEKLLSFIDKQADLETKSHIG